MVNPLGQGSDTLDINPGNGFHPPHPAQFNMLNRAALANQAAGAATANEQPPPPAPIDPTRVTHLPQDPTEPIDLTLEEGDVDPAAPMDQLDEPVNNAPTDTQTPEAKKADEKKKAEEASENKRNIVRKISMFVAPILLLIGIAALCFIAAVVITGFGWVPFTVSLIVGLTCLTGCGLITYFGLIRIKKAPEDKTPKPIPQKTNTNTNPPN
jgi:cation transport ATPase